MAGTPFEEFLNRQNMSGYKGAGNSPFEEFLSRRKTQDGDLQQQVTVPTDNSGDGAEWNPVAIQMLRGKDSTPEMIKKDSDAVLKSQIAKTKEIFGGVAPTASRVISQINMKPAIVKKGAAQQPLSETEELRLMAQQFQRKYDDYVQSAEYQSVVEAQKKKTMYGTLAGGYAASAGLLQNEQTPTVGSDYASSAGIHRVTPEEEREKAILKEADRRKAEADYWNDLATMAEDLESYNAWSDVDKALLDRYISGRIGSGDTMLADIWQMSPMGGGIPGALIRGGQLISAEDAKAELAQKYGREAVENMAESVTRYRNEQRAQEVQQGAQRHSEGLIGGTLASVGAVAGSTMGSITAPVGVVGDLLTRTGRYSTLDPNQAGNLPNVYAGAVKENVSRQIAGEGEDSNILRKGAALMYQGGMSAVDNIVRVAAGGKFGSLAMAAAGSFGQTVQQASEQGATPEQAIALGVINAGVEAATEYIPLDNLFKAAKAGNLKQLLSNVWKQGMSEVTEEEIGLVVTTFAEAAILQEKSSYNQTIQEQMAEGKSYEEAKHFANMQILKEAGETAVVSFISGGLMEGGNQLINYTGTKSTPQQGTQGGQEGNVNTEAVIPQKQIQPQVEISKPVAEQGTPVAATQQGTGLELRAVDKPFVAPGTADTQKAESVSKNQENDTGKKGFVTGDIMTAQLMGKDIMQVQRLAEATGRDVVFFTAPVTEDGVDNGCFKNGKIYINVNAQNPFAQIIGHELTHSIESTGSYKKLSELVMSRIRDGGGDIYQLRKEKQAFYAKMGQQMDTTEAIDREIVAEYVEKNLLTDEQAIMEVVQRDRTLGQRIKEWLDRVLAKLGNTNAQERAFLAQARDLYAKALKETQGSFQSNGATANESNYDEGGWDSNEDMLRWARFEHAAGRLSEDEYNSIVDSYEQYLQEQLMDSSPAQHSYAGINAKNADMKALELAKQMEEQEVSSETIRQQTGWFRGKDGKWRFEIDDNTARVSDNVINYMTLEELLPGAEVFEAYPDMKNISVVFQNLEPGVNAQYNRQFDHIDVSYKLKNDPDGIRSAVLHEIQHAIQNREGFTHGGTVAYWERRIKEGYDSRKKSDIQEARDAEQKLQQFREEDPDLYRDMMELDAMAPNLPRGAMNWDTLEQIEEDPPEWQAYDARRDELEEIYGEKMWDFNSALYDLQRINKRPARTAEELYWDTAGEIEARNVAGRRNLTEEQRKNTPPILGGEDTVFAEDTGIYFDKELSDYPYNMQTVIQDYLDAVDEQVLHFVQEVQSGRAWKGKKLSVGTVSAKMAEDVKRLTGVQNTEGVPILMNSNAVEHITKRHGKNGKHDNTMRNNQDIARINYVLQNYDSMELSYRKNTEYKNRDGSFSQNVILSKKINGTYFVIEAVPDTGKIGIVSAYMDKNGAPQVPDELSPGRNVQNELASAPNEMLAQEDNSVKGQHSFSSVESLQDDTQSENDEQELTGEAVKIARDTLPRKAREYLTRAEWNLLDKIGQSLSVPRFAQRDPLRGMVQEISNAYLENGSVPDTLVNDLFDRAYEAGMIADREFYDQYKHVKARMLTNPITISDQDKGDIADYELFRKGTKGALRIVNKGGLPVDSAYRELQEMAPELFPDDIMHPADQLMRMFEVSKSIAIAERTLNEYYADDKENFRAWARNDFAASIGDAMSELRNVKRYAEDRAAAKAETEAAPKTPEEAEGYYARLKDARRTYEKVMAKNLLTDHDSAIVGKLLTGQITLDSLNPDTDNVKGIAAAYEAKAEYERLTKLLAEYRNGIRAQYRENADGYLETANTWKDKKSGIAYSRETMTRNIEDIVPDRDLAKAINREYFDSVRTAEAKATRFKNEMRDRIRKLDLSRMKKKGNAVSEAHAVQLLGEAEDNIRVLERSRGRMKNRDGKTLAEWRAVVDNLWAENPNLDANKIENAVKEFRTMYDELFVLMNRVRIANGYEPVNYRSGYFPHFQPGDGDGLLAHFGKAMGIDLSVTALPTTINGLTHTFKPGIQWFGNAQERLGFNTVYDAVEGFDKYIEGISSVIYQTENIQKLRALASQARYRTSDDGLRKQVDAVYADPNLTEEQKQAQINEIYNNGKYALSNFVNELDEYTNLLANKKSRLDRTVESLVGRTKLYNIMKWMESRVGANMIAGNLSSAFTNFIPLTQAYGQLSTKNLLHGMWDARRNIIKSDGFVEASAFLTNRRGSDPLVRAWSENVADKLGIVMEMIDNSVSYAVTKGAYYQNLQRGLSEAEAIYQADITAAKIMAERSKGGMPTLMQSHNPVLKLFTQFQLEVNNQFSEVFKDMPRAYRDKGMLALSFGLLKYFLAAFLFNELYEKVAGRRAALDPIDIARDFINDWKEVGFGEATGNFAVNVLGEMPFTSALTLVGIETDGGRYAVSSAIPDIPKLWDAMTDKEMSSEKRYEDFWSEVQKPITYLASPFGGGNQLAKAYKGLKAYAEGGSYTVDKSTGKDKLQYPIFKDDGDEAWDVARAAIFGKSSMDEAQDWVDSGFKGLSVKATELYQTMTESGAKDYEVYRMIQEINSAKKLKGTERKKAEEAAIASGNFSEDEKKLAVGYIIGTELLTDAGNPSEYSKFLNATAQGLAVDQYMQIRSAGAKTDDLLECLDNGMKADEAVEYLVSLEKLEGENGDEDLSSVEMWRHAVNFSTVEAVQLMALRGQMNESQYAKAESSNHFGVSPDAFVGYYEIRSKYDQNGDGSYSQAEVKAAIDSMGKYHLSTEEKAALWQIVTGTKSAKNNPYSVSVGERVLKYLSND